MGKEDYKNEKKGHGFLCVPKELLFDNRYKQLTIEAILLYAYMLDRLKLSIENGWKDSDGKVFIYFSLESIMDLLKCSKGKAISTLKELDEKLCLLAIDEMVDILGEGIANICYVINPEVVVLGGGIMAQEQFLKERVECAVKRYLVSSIEEHTKIVFAKHQNDAGMLGAFYHFCSLH